MNRFPLIIIILLVLNSCGSSKSRNVRTKRSTNKNIISSKKSRTRSGDYPIPKKAKNTGARTVSSNTISSVVNHAKKNIGVRYKMGGTTKSGMDCSGLLYTSFKKENLTLPRTSGAMAVSGDWIDLKKVEKGDLLFFATNKKKGRRINHVGLVTESRPGYVKFIHSTTSRGVIESLLSEKYWYFAFVQARRVM